MVVGILEYTVHLLSGQASASELSERIHFQSVLQVDSGMHILKINQIEITFM